MSKYMYINFSNNTQFQKYSGFVPEFYTILSQLGICTARKRFLCYERQRFAERVFI